jgi:hypothetical protein
MAIDPVHRLEQRLGDEVEIAPVDQELEAVEVERLVVAVDRRDLLGAGKIWDRESRIPLPSRLLKGIHSN